MAGQINLTTELGRAITTIASQTEYTSFCEVGAWNGLGSTRCLYEGLRNRPEARLYSIEADPAMLALARQVWTGVPTVSLLFGTLHRTGMTREDVLAHPLYPRVRDHYILHYDTEMDVLRTSPLVSVPPCDVILLDGGEFSTEGDWATLYHDGLRVVILDDTQVIKTNRILHQLLADPAWKCVRNEPGDRNGWAIFERV